MRIMPAGFKYFLAVLGLSISSPVCAQDMAIPSFADLVEKLSPSVVNISSTQKPEAYTEGEVIPAPNSMDTDNIISHLNKKHYTLGSGFIIDKDGYILTNNHVIDQSGGIKVVLSDNSEHQAKIIGSDNKTDIALIKIDTDKDLQPVKFGDSDKMRVGDWILAIGNPFGLGGSVTAGIVSAKSRDIESGPYDNFIQTDASINQGSSGGPMFNLNGEVIGINTAIFSTTGGNMGIGFAIPVNLTNFVVKQLKENGIVKRGWIGLKIQPGLTLTNNANNLAEGLLISGITEGSSAATAGIEAGDIILALDGTPVDSAQNFSRKIAESEISSNIDLKIWRNGQEKIIKIKIEAMPSEASKNAETTEENKNSSQTSSTLQTEDAPVLQKPEEQIETRQEVKEEEPVTPSLLLDSTNKEPSTNTPTPVDYSDFDDDEFQDYTFEASGIVTKDLSMEDLDEYKLKADTMGIVVTDVRIGGEAEMKGIKKGTVISQINKRNIYNIESVQSIVEDAIRTNSSEPLMLTIMNGSNINTVTVRAKAS